eukprot:UN18765
MLCHGKADDVVLYKHGERSADALKSTGFCKCGIQVLQQTRALYRSRGDGRSCQVVYSKLP